MVRDHEEKAIDIALRRVTPRDRASRLLVGFLAASGLLAIPLSLLWRSRSITAVPLMVHYSAAAFLAVTAIAGQHSATLSSVSILALVVIPASVGHLGLIFPRERKVAREVRSLSRVPYLSAAALFLAGLVALHGTPLIWPTFLLLLVTLTLGSWAVLISASAFAVRESNSPIERARARILCFGGAALPIVPTLIVSGPSYAPSTLAGAYVCFATLSMPLPIGLAISRYNLFNLDHDLRSWIGRFIVLATSALALSIVLEFMISRDDLPSGRLDRSVGYFIAFATLAAIESFRGRALGFLDSVFVPRLEHLRTLSETFGRQVIQLRDEDEIAARLGQVFATALGTQSVGVYILAGEHWRCAHADGESIFLRSHLAGQAALLLGRAELIHVALTADNDQGIIPLIEGGVEIVASIANAGERFGILMLSGSNRRSPYSRIDCDFVASVTAQAGIALRNTRIAAEMLSIERQVTTSRVSLALAHDLRKELDWLARLVRRLPSRLNDRDRLERDVGMIQDFTNGLIDAVGSFVRESFQGTPGGPSKAPLDALIDRAVRRMHRIHGTDRIVVSLDPSLRNEPAHSNLERILGNLLDNGLCATAAGPIHLYATRDRDWLRLIVSDTGIGLPAGSSHEDVFAAGFSTRGTDGGLGVGLTVSRDLVRAIGGSLWLEPNPGGGTRATVRVRRVEAA
jgi:signal transduction histidine kinase